MRDKNLCIVSLVLLIWNVRVSGGWVGRQVCLSTSISIVTTVSPFSYESKEIETKVT